MTLGQIRTRDNRATRNLKSSLVEECWIANLKGNHEAQSLMLSEIELWGCERGKGTNEGIGSSRSLFPVSLAYSISNDLPYLAASNSYQVAQERGSPLGKTRGRCTLRSLVGKKPTSTFQDGETLSGEVKIFFHRKRRRAAEFPRVTRTVVWTLFEARATRRRWSSKDNQVSFESRIGNPVLEPLSFSSGKHYFEVKTWVFRLCPMMIYSNLRKQALHQKSWRLGFFNLFVFQKVSHLFPAWCELLLNGKSFLTSLGTAGREERMKKRRGHWTSVSRKESKVGKSSSEARRSRSKRKLKFKDWPIVLSQKRTRSAASLRETERGRDLCLPAASF